MTSKNRSKRGPDSPQNIRTCCEYRPNAGRRARIILLQILHMLSRPFDTLQTAWDVTCVLKVDSASARAVLQSQEYAANALCLAAFRATGLCACIPAHQIKMGPFDFQEAGGLQPRFKPTEATA